MPIAVGGVRINACGVAPDVLDEISDQRRVKRDPGDDLFNGLACLGDRCLVSIAGGSALSLLVFFDCRLKPPQTTEGREKTSNLRRFQLAAFGQDHHLFRSDFLPTEPVTDLEEGVDSQRNFRNRTALRDLPRFDPPPDLNLLLGGQAGNVPHLLQVEADRVLARPAAGSFEEINGFEGTSPWLLTVLGKGIELLFTN